MRSRLLTAATVALFVVVTCVGQSPGPDVAGLAWLRANAVPLTTVEAGSGFADLVKLKAAIGDARIVSLGESTHGTREIFQAKHRLVEYLASELGFTIFSIEANMPEAYRLNDYVLQGKGDSKTLLQGMYFWTWNTEEVLAMIEWMRAFNQSGKGRIEFTGFDIQTPTVAMEIVQELLQKVDPEKAKTAGETFRDVAALRPGQGSAGFGVATGTFPVKLAAGRKIAFSGAIRTENLVDGFAGLWWRADGPKGVLAFDNMQGRGPSATTTWKRYEISLEVPADTVNINFGVIMPGRGTAWFDDLQVTIDGVPYDPADLFDFDFESGALKGFFTPASQYRVQVDQTTAARGKSSLRIEWGAVGGTEAPKVSAAEASKRCRELVARMEASREKYSKGAGRQTVDWAIQNARVVHQYAQMVANEVSRDECMAKNVKWILDTAPKGTRVVLWAHNGHVARVSMGQFRAMGSYLGEWYGKDHLVVGFALNRGEYTAVGQGKGLGRHPLQPAEPGSYEHAFARAGFPRFVLDIRAARAGDAGSGWLRRPMQFRSIGALAMDQQFAQADLASLFDLVVYLDETAATRGLWEANPKN